MEVNWTKLGKTEKVTINPTKRTNHDGSIFTHYKLKFSCTTDRKFWDLPDISVTEEEDLDDKDGIAFTIPSDFRQYEREELMEMRLHPKSLMRPINLPPLDCVKAYH